MTEVPALLVFTINYLLLFLVEQLLIYILNYVIILYFAIRLSRKEYNWYILDNWAFRSLTPSEIPDVIFNDSDIFTALALGTVCP
jgi:hypothetical protein